MPVGVLALQGDFEAHRKVLTRLGVEASPVRTPGELEGVRALVLPGGESTTMLKLAERGGLLEALRQRLASGLPALATCAGVVVLAARVEPQQPSLGILDVSVLRNAYGRQIASAVVPLRVEAQLGDPAVMEGVFIRAPRITSVGDGVEVLAWRGEDPVLVRQRNILAATFHPELTNDLRVHWLFVESL